MRKTVLQIVMSGAFAASVLACSGPAMEAAGLVMQDAGAMLYDAGVALAGDSGGGGAGAGAGNGDAGSRVVIDAGRLLMDAGAAVSDAGSGVRRDGGRVIQDGAVHMMDAGQALVDAADGANGSAQAQGCGDWCTSNGALRIITADLDSTRYVRAVTTSADWSLSDGPLKAGSNDAYAYATKLHDGPLMVQGIAGLSSSSSSTSVTFVVPKGTDCSVTAQLVLVVGIKLPAEAATLSQGMVRGDETLCAAYAMSVATGGTPSPPRADLVLTGFRPYE